MSEKFGLDWQRYDYRRIICFMKIIEAESEKSKKGKNSTPDGDNRSNLR